MHPEKPLDPQLRRLDLARGPLFHTETGEGPTVVAVHGLPATSRDFRWLDAALAGRVRLFRLDLPGFGRSPKSTAGGESIAELGGVVAEFCDAMNLDDVIVVGHSMGGAIAVDAATRTDRIAGLCLVSSSGSRFHRGIFPRTYRTLLALTDIHAWIRRAVVAVATPLARKLGYSKRLSTDEMLWGVRLSGDYDPRRFGEQISSLEKSVLVAWSADDPAIEESISKETVDLAKHAEAVRFETGGHNLQKSRAIELSEEIVRLAEGLSRPRAAAHDR